MKFFTKNLVWFSITFALASLAFRYALSTLLAFHHYGLVWVAAVLYFAVNFFLGWYFGRRDNLTLPLYDVGFRFHFVTYFIFNIMAELWFLSGMNWEYEKIRTVHLTALIWGGFIVIHFIIYLFSRRDAIKGLKRSEIFE
jgi:hypothetical protein